MSELKAELSDNQIKKLAKGGTVQLRPEMMGKGIALKLDAKKAKKLHNQLMKGKGARLHMSEKEIEGSGLFDIVKKGWNLLKKSGLARKALKGAAKVALPAIAGAVGGPAAASKVAAVTEKYADKAVDALGNVAGFGLEMAPSKSNAGKGVRAKGVRAKGLRGGEVRKSKKVTVSTDSSNFMPPTSAPQQPPVGVWAMPDQSYTIAIYKGDVSGSGLLPAGYRRR